MKEDTHRFLLSFRIWHPNIDPGEITAAMAMNPDVTHRAGEARKTPKGEALAGAYRESYWCAPHEQHTGDLHPALAIEAWLPRLQEKEEFLAKVRADGGTAEFYLTWGAGEIPGHTLPARLLSRLGALQIDLSVEVFRNKA